MRGLALPRQCVVLHRTAQLEEQMYGEVVSPSVAAHMRACHEDRLVLS